MLINLCKLVDFDVYVQFQIISEIFYPVLLPCMSCHCQIVFEMYYKNILNQLPHCFLITQFWFCLSSNTKRNIRFVMRNLKNSCLVDNYNLNSQSHQNISTHVLYTFSFFSQHLCVHFTVLQIIKRLYDLVNSSHKIILKEIKNAIKYL